MLITAGFDAITEETWFRSAEHVVTVAAGESVLDAGLRTGIDLPHGCRAGVRGTCRALLSPPDPGGAGVVLACRTAPAQGSTVDFDLAVR